MKLTHIDGSETSKWQTLSSTKSFPARSRDTLFTNTSTREGSFRFCISPEATKKKVRPRRSFYFSNYQKIATMANFQKNKGDSATTASARPHVIKGTFCSTGKKDGATSQALHAGTRYLTKEDGQAPRNPFTRSKTLANPGGITVLQISGVSCFVLTEIELNNTDPLQPRSDITCQTHTSPHF